MSFDAIIDVYDSNPVQPRYRKEPESVLASAYSLVADQNASLPRERRILRSTVQEIVRREGADFPKVQRAIMQFVATTENPDTKNPTAHRDLLHPGHPLSAAANSGNRTLTARYFASDPALDESIRPLVASAIKTEPDSPQRKFIVARLDAVAPRATYAKIIANADASVNEVL